MKRSDRAKSTLAEANLGLAVSLAKRYQKRVLPLMDLIQEGYIGLMRAISKRSRNPRGRKLTGMNSSD